MFSKWMLQGIVAGKVTAVFRRWPECRVVAGDRFRTEAGTVVVSEVGEVAPELISEDDARQAGYRSPEALRVSLDRHGRGRVFRLRVRYAGVEVLAADDPPVELDLRERADLDRRLARLDVESPQGPWTRWLLDVLRATPGLGVAELAKLRGRPVGRCRSDVWKLRELGLVEGGAVGYRLTGRGLAYVCGR